MKSLIFVLALMCLSMSVFSQEERIYRVNTEVNATQSTEKVQMVHWMSLPITEKGVMVTPKVKPITTLKEGNSYWTVVTEIGRFRIPRSKKIHEIIVERYIREDGSTEIEISTRLKTRKYFWPKLRESGFLETIFTSSPARVWNDTLN